MKPVSTQSPPAPVRKRDPEIPPDDPSRDENHDETRRNGFDPAVARALDPAHAPALTGSEEE